MANKPPLGQALNSRGVGQRKEYKNLKQHAYGSKVYTEATKTGGLSSKFHSSPILY